MNEIKLCPKCGRKIDFNIVSNLYWCNSCGYKLIDDKNPNKNILVSTDLRRLMLSWESGWDKVYSHVYQLDLLKIMNMAQHLSIPKYVDWAERIIHQIDKIEKRGTDFNRLDKLPRIFLKDYLDSRTV
ncbi:hypothetical protein LCGC14_0363400 [marine sediment metagenome]|uniref:Uncharacterized protein n=1 Tax=marine sediment metagenome TaxID=412755 RepID=A0A0F9WFP1_9ZZZZ